MWSDRETVDDCLGFDSYVASLAELCLDDDLSPLTLGIFGSWGSGKSSLMTMLKAALDAMPNERNVRTLWFNAWRYEGKEEIQPALVHAILARLQEGQSLGGEVKDLFDSLKRGASLIKLTKFLAKSAITLTPDINQFLDCFKDEGEKLSQTMQTFEKDFEDCLKKMGIHRVVVFIDDLDRCQSSKVIEAFETIKLFLNVPQCTFVIGADARKIEHAITASYGTDSEIAVGISGDIQRTPAEDYLEKIVQIPFRIPEQRLRDIEAYVGLLTMRPHSTPEGWKALLAARQEMLSKESPIHDLLVEWLNSNSILCKNPTACIEALKEVQPFVAILAQGLRGNPRQMKRFLNIREMRSRLAKANRLETRQDILIKLLILEYTWKTFFQDVVETFDTQTGKCDLIAELEKAIEKGETRDDASAMLTAALSATGLPEFLMSAQRLGDESLTDYLFLSQTALNARKTVSLAPPEELAKSYVDKIASIDRIVSLAAAKKACREDAAVQAAVIKGLLVRLGTITDKRARVYSMNGLAELSRGKREVLEQLVQFLKDLDVTDNQPLALAALPILIDAKKQGLQGVDPITTRLSGASSILNTVAKAKSSGKKG